MKLDAVLLENYLEYVYNEKVKVNHFHPLGKKSESKIEQDLKGFGYGVPYVIEFSIRDDVKEVVLETMRTEGFGHDHFSDRAQVLLWQHSTFNNLPRHVRSVDVGAFGGDGSLRSLGEYGEFFLLTELVHGSLYHLDLDRLRETGELGEHDEKRCLALSDYLVEIHKLKKEAPHLYVRRARELVGHGECIMGLLDSYPQHLEYIDESYLIGIERDCVAWRWSLKRRTHRLSQVHGDFHPWNILFREGTDFTILDRSRGEWGEPADDVAALTINYLFYSLQKFGELSGVFESLFNSFWTNYLTKTGDREILEVVQPFYAWRSLVLASPLWYPTLPRNVRVCLLNFAKHVLRFEKFDLSQVNSYLSKK
jgi:hypothetical protein